MSRTFSASQFSYYANATSLFNPTGNVGYSCSAWFLPTADADQYYPGSIITGTHLNDFIGLGCWKGLALYGFTPGVTKSSSIVQSGPGILQLGKWQHVAYVFNGVTRISSLFLNGVEVSYASKSTGSGVASGYTFAPRIGSPTMAQSASYLTSGNIDSVAVWNRPLTPAEIVTSMGYQGALNVPTSLTAYWPLLGIADKEAEFPVNTYPLASGSLAVTPQGPNSPGQKPPSPVVNIVMQDAGSTLLSLPVTAGASSEQFIRGLIQQGVVSSGDGKTLYPVEDVVALVATDA